MKKSSPFIFTTLSILAFITAVGCGDSANSKFGNLPVTSMQIGTKTYELEIAADDASREHGLMERDTLAKDRGMIFVFAQAAEQSFWMHHTRFPLDIIYADDQAKVVSIHTMKAYDESSTPSDGPSKYAIELAAGEAASSTIKIGDQLRMPDGVKSITAQY